MSSNLDQDRHASAATGMQNAIEADIEYELGVAIATRNLQQVYALASRLALLPKANLDVAYARVTAQFGKEARISDLRAHVKLEISKLKQEYVSDAWCGDLLKSDKGVPKPCLENITLFLENSPEWDGVLGYNEFTAGYVILKSPPEPITTKVGAEIDDQFDTEVTRWIERKGLMVKPDSVRRAVDAFAKRNSYHPVRDFLEALPPWDEVPRLGSWLHDYCGVASSDESPNLFAETAGQKFLISAVARIYRPGCKVDHMLILEGLQGAGKSTLVSTLFGDEWFTDQLPDMGSKDASMQLRGRWVIEIGELEVLKRAEVERVKMFVTARKETFRPPYGRRVITFPRQCVFVGTTNAQVYLKDETGNRRFWPVACGRFDLDRLKEDREQLWAEALHLYHAGASWWPDNQKFVADATEQQLSRYMPDTWQDDIRAWLDNPLPIGSVAFESTRDFVTVRDVLTHCVQRPIGHRSQLDDNRVGKCLLALGWKKKQRRVNDVRRWVYERGDL